MIVDLITRCLVSRGKKTVKPKPVKKRKNGQPSFVVTKRLGEIDGWGSSDVSVLRPTPRPDWLRFIHMLGSGLCVVWFADEQKELAFFKLKSGKFDYKDIVGDIVRAIEDGGAIKSKVIVKVSTPWETYGSMLDKYVEWLKQKEVDVPKSLWDRYKTRKDALDSAGNIEYDIWDVVYAIEQECRPASDFSGTSYPTYDLFYTKSGIYKYYTKSGRIQKKGDLDAWKSVPRPKNAPKWKDRKNV